MAKQSTLPSPIRPNVLDRVVTYINPRAGADRFRARAFLALSGGYSGARTDSKILREWHARTGSADSDSIGDLPTLRRFSRDLVRNNPIAAGAYETNLRNVIGTGLRPRPQPDAEFLKLTDKQAEEWAEQAKRIYWLFASQCDLERRQDHASMQSLVFGSQLESGDVLVVRRFVQHPGDLLGTKLQIVEADRIETPATKMSDATIRAGVEVDGNGAPRFYHVRNHHPGEITAGTAEWVRVPAFMPDGDRAALHLYRRKRPGQTRGIPYLAPVIESLKQLGRYMDAELYAAVIAGMITAFIETTDGEGLGPLEGDTTEQKDAAAAKGEVGFDYGAIIELNKGETVSIPNAGRPNVAFDAFVSAMCRNMSPALQLPYELLVLHFSASFSASRAALLQAWKYFYTQRDWIAYEFCQPTYEWAITEAVARGLIAAPGFLRDPLVRRAWLNCDWRGDAAGQIDPLKEIQAAQKKIDYGISTIDEQTAEITGGDFRANHRQRARERAMRVADGLDQENAERILTESTQKKDGEKPPKPDDDPDANDREEEEES